MAISSNSAVALTSDSNFQLRLRYFVVRKAYLLLQAKTTGSAEAYCRSVVDGSARFDLAGFAVAAVLPSDVTDSALTDAAFSTAVDTAFSYLTA